VIPITAPTDKRFLRTRVQPVRRRTTWRAALAAARVAGVLVLIAFAAYRVAVVLTTADLLRVNRITVHGIERLSKGEALALVDGLRGQNIFRADLETARQRLLESPWVAEAVLRKRLPASVDVFVTERRPMGIARLGGQLYLVDDRGRVFDEYGPRYAEFDLPVIDGLAAPGKGRVDSARAALASRVVSALAVHPDVARQVSQIDVRDPNDARVLLDTDSAILHLGDRQFLERLESYLDLAPRMRERMASIDDVDLRHGARVFVRGAVAKAGR
jgi:cell division septal protein FtsQ